MLAILYLPGGKGSKIMKRLLCAALLMPLQGNSVTFCRVDLRDGTIERRVVAVCDGRLIKDKDVGRNNLGLGAFTEAMSEVLALDPNLKILSCEGLDLSTCYLSSR